jgi:L-lactate dehydrogenase
LEGIKVMSQRTSIGIIGTGWVGSSVAISILHTGTANELILYDAREGLAEGETMDLAHGSSFYPSAAVRSGSLEEIYDADAVVIAAGKGGSPGQSRLDLLRDNLVILRELARKMRGYKGIVVIVTNPVDVLTSDFTKTSGLPPERVIGTGTMLDTARLRQMLGQKLSLDPRSIHAQVIGEHGDSEVVLWSSAYVGGMPLRSWEGWRRDDEASIANEVRIAAHEIIKRKGSTNHAIGLVTSTLLRWMLRGERRVVTISRLQSGAFGLNDIALSLPTIVSAEGATEVLELELDENEKVLLERSASVLRKAAELTAP